MILLTGDLHGHIDIDKFYATNFPIGHSILGKNDYVIVLGDFGLLWNNSKEEKELRKWLNSCPWTTLFLDGNHENFTMIKELPLIEMLGGKVGKVDDSIFHLRRGEVYIIEGKKFFIFGGAASIDKLLRTEGTSWWPEEIPDWKETNYGLMTLSDNNFKVDYILTHTCPQKIALQIHNRIYEERPDPTRIYLDEINKRTKFKKWFFAHWHDEKEFDGKYVMLYNKIRGLE